MIDNAKFSKARVKKAPDSFRGNSDAAIAMEVFTKWVHSERSTRRTLGECAVAVLCSCLPLYGQTAEPKPQMSEDVFKNVQVLKGIPIDEFLSTMGVFSAALGISCEDCHGADDSKWENLAIDSPMKRRTRGMIQMMATINKNNFGGRQMVTCYTCHRGSERSRPAPP